MYLTIHPVQMSLQVQSDQYIPEEDIHGEMIQLEKQLDELEQRGVELEKELRNNPNGITSHCFLWAFLCEITSRK